MIKVKQNLMNAAIALLLVIVATACTHNDGDIGPWFGLWRVERLIVDGNNGEPNSLAVEHVDGKHINLTLITPKGKTVVYRLVKCV